MMLHSALGFFDVSGPRTALLLFAKVVGVGAFIQISRGIWWFLKLVVIAPPFDPLRHLPGPEAPRMANHFRQVMDPELSPDTHERWKAQFGKNFRYQGFGTFDFRLMSFDIRVISHVMNSPLYQKPWQTRKLLSRLLGRGVFAMEDEAHRLQRRILGPAFTHQAVRGLAPVMWQKAEELKDIWSNMVSEKATTKWDGIIAGLPEHSLPPIDPFALNERKEDVIIDVAHWVSRAAFDVIGLAGFDYAFRALNDDSEEVCRAYRDMFSTQDKQGFKEIVQIYFPIVEKILPDDKIRTVNSSLEIIRRRGTELVRSKKEAILAEIKTSEDIWDKDLLSLLIKANLSENPSQRLSDSEILDQLSSFLFAGSDTTAISIAWCFHFLALYPEVQVRLRDELASHDISNIDTLDSIPYLDAVIREILRIAPPVHGTIRVATKDDMIPVSEPVQLRSGDVVDSIRIRKGSYIHIPIEGINYSKDIWGDDALVFNPDRWLLGSPSNEPVPGLAGIMSFTFGPHACVGWRFSLTEMKVFLAATLPHLSFAPVAEIRKYNAIITRPYVDDRFEHGSALPLRVSKFVS